MTLNALSHRVGISTRESIFTAERSKLSDEVAASSGLAVHADGKKLDEHGTVTERFPIALSGFEGGEARIIEIPKIDNGQGITMANATLAALKAVNADTKIVAVVGDTTSSITGIHSGMFRKLEDLIGRPVLKTPCRHHSIDLLQGAAFKALFGPTKSPARSDFVTFRKAWPTIKPQIKQIAPLKNSISHPMVLAALDELKKSCDSVLADKDVRSDRRELAELNMRPHSTHGLTTPPAPQLT